MREILEMRDIIMTRATKGEDIKNHLIALREICMDFSKKNPEFEFDLKGSDGDLLASITSMCKNLVSHS